MEAILHAFRWAGSTWRRARPLFQSASFSRSLYPDAAFAAPAPDFVPRAWLACLLLTGFWLALFAYAARIESGPGPLLIAFSFFGALYTGIAVVATAPVYAPCAARWGARTLHSGAAVPGAVLAWSARIISVLVRPVRLVLQVLGAILHWALDLVSRGLAALLVNADAALAFAVSLIVFVMQALSALVRPASRLVNRSSSWLARTVSVSRTALERVLRSTGSRVAPVAVTVISFFNRPLVAAHRRGLLLIAWAGPAWLSVSGAVSHLAHSLLDTLAGFVRGTGSRLVQLVTRIGEWVYSLFAVLWRFLWKLAADAAYAVAGPARTLVARTGSALASFAGFLWTALRRALVWTRLSAWHAVIGMGRFMRPLVVTGMSILARLALAAEKVLVTEARRAVSFLLPIAQRLVSHFLIPVLKWIGRAAFHLFSLVFRSASRLISQAGTDLARPLALVGRRIASGALTILSYLGSLVVRGLTQLMKPILLILEAFFSLIGKVILISARPVVALVHRTGDFARVLLASASRLVRRLGPARVLLVPACGLLLVVTACAVVSRPSLRIVAGSGFSTFEKILTEDFARRSGSTVKVDYLGSLDIAQRLEAGTLDYDAIWDGDSMWTTISDAHHVVKHRESTMLSPIVLGLKRPLAEKLGWVGREVSMQEILAVAQNVKFRIMMTSASQSNSGTFAYLGMLYAFANPTDALTLEDLGKPEVRSNVKQLLGMVDRTSESSGWLRDLFEKEYDQHDAMFNYESHIIELNQRLAASGKQPLFIVYPKPGLGIADFPLSYLDRSDAGKEKLFLELQKYLMSDEVQARFAAKGRRTSACGMAARVDLKVFNPDWGVDVTRGCAPLRLPSAAVIRGALNLYQTTLRKPSFTAFLLDFSGSMGKASLPERPSGSDQVKSAMHTLLNQEAVAPFYLQASPDDITVVIAFDDEIMSEWIVEGNDKDDLGRLDSAVSQQQVDGNTDIYLPTARALQFMKSRGIGDRLPSIILMTDGWSNTGDIHEVETMIEATGLRVPVYGITFGDASVDQLQKLADLTSGRVFDGKKDLLAAFRKARGNN